MKKVLLYGGGLLLGGGLAYGLYNYNRASKSIEEDKCILIIGAPASGKGTQAERIKEKYKLLYFVLNIL